MSDQRHEPKRERTGKTHQLKIGDATLYVTTGEHPDGSLAEVFVKLSKRGSTLDGFAAWIGTTISLALQHGVPLVDLAGVPIHELRFEPSGNTNDPEIGYANSIADAVMRRLVLDYCTDDELLLLGMDGERAS